MIDPDVARLFTAQIMAGEWDDELEAIADALTARHKVRGLEAASMLQVNDKVVFNDQDKPPWPGLTGVVTDKTRGGRIKVKLDVQDALPAWQGRRQIKAGVVWTVPSTWLDRIED